jgi:hypothetical protein
MPFCYRIELAVLCGLEAEFFAETSTDTTFDVHGRTPLIDRDGMVTPNVIPDSADCLSLEASQDILQTVLKFVAVRLKLLHIVRLDDSITHKRHRFFESIFNDSYHWDLSFFNSLHLHMTGKHVALLASHYEQREATFVNRWFLVTLQHFEQFFSLTDIKLKQMAIDNNTELSLKAVWACLNQSFWSATKSVSSIRYVAPYTTRYAFQVNDYVRDLLVGQFTDHDNAAQDALVAPDGDLQGFVHTSLVTMLMKLAFLLLARGRCNCSITVDDCVLKMTDEIYSESIGDYQNQIAVKAAQQLGRVSKQENTEIRLFAEIRALIVPALQSLVVADQLVTFRASASEVLAAYAHTLNRPNASLKPDSSSKSRSGAFPWKSRRTGTARSSRNRASPLPVSSSSCSISSAARAGRSAKA